MNIKESVDNYKMIILYLWYINSLHKGKLLDEEFKGKIGFMPQLYLSKMAGLNIKTLYKYNAILEDKKILYIVRHQIEHSKSSKDNSTAISGVTNTYSRYIDRVLCEKFAKNIKGNNYSESALKDKAFRQSVKQKLYQFEIGKEYSLNELIELKNCIDTYNQNTEKQKRRNRIDITKLINTINEKHDSINIDRNSFYKSNTSSVIITDNEDYNDLLE